MKFEIKFAGNKKINAELNGHIIKTDQEIQAGGEGSAPAPFDLFLASIGTCAGIYVKSFCDQRAITTDDLRIVQHIEYDMAKRMIGKIALEIIVPDNFPEQYRQAVVHAANICAVKKHLQDPPQIETFVSTK